MSSYRVFTFRKYHAVKGSSKVYRPLFGHEGGRLTGPVLQTQTSSHRTIVNILMATVPRLLRLRYLVLGGAISGGAAMSKKYEQWKDGLPDTAWIKEYFPASDEINDKFKSYWSEFKKSSRSLQAHVSLPDKTWIPPGVRQSLSDQKDYLLSLLQMPALGGLADNGAAILLSGELSTSRLKLKDDNQSAGENDPHSTKDASGTESTVNASVGGFFSSGSQPAPATERKDVQEELITLQMQYQKEIEKLEKENKELRRQMLLQRESMEKGAMNSNKGFNKTVRRSPIEMYSEVLDELSSYDTAYDCMDHMPRVVVVGDQSSGKTSVLEMIVQARIFPRGSGEMMTRSPVMVTLSEAPFHVAKFSDSAREYDLSKESDLSALRNEVERRMKNSVLRGQTVSSEVISMSVKGPGLQRMVLVDLPGVISTMTTGMATDTKSSIHGMCKKFMANPNAIILCIQDGSIDAERSNVTELVTSVDPEGKRTIFVLTKVDLAEASLYNPDRIKQILDGKLFPMKALGYFAVVTGKNNQSESIQSIREYEEQFFKQSKLFRDGVLKPTQMTTRNLSMAVSARFWKMVHDSIEQQADEFKATRYNLETEWRNTYPGERELDRQELFDKTKGEILDELINLSQLTSKEWEDEFVRQLWNKSYTHIFEAIYMPASSNPDLGSFKTAIDIKLKQWADKALPQMAVDVGINTLKNRYLNMLDKKSDKKPTESRKETEASVTEALKLAVVDEVFRRHQWDSKAEESLRILQQLSLENKHIHDRHQWESAVSFMETTLKDMLEKVDAKLYEMVGPGMTEQWTSWKYRSADQSRTDAIKSELDRLLGHEKVRPSKLSNDELTAVMKNLQANKVAGVTEAMVRETWHQVYRKKFLSHALETARICRKAFSFYQKSLSAEECGLDCKDVLLFWRVQLMIQTTSKALTQQLTNHECRRLERIMKDVLDDYAADLPKLEKLISGHRVKLAEDIQRVRRIQEKLEQLILHLNKEKS